MAIGILGGTFNPLHVGHLVLAQDALERFELSQVFFIPCSVPPHKSGSAVAAPHHRLAMVEAAIEGDPRFEALDIEIRRDGISYSVDTVREIRRMYSESEPAFIIGADTLPELHLWKDVYTLLELCRLLPFVRPGFDLASMTESGLRLKPPWPERLRTSLCAGHLVDVSSSEIRRRIAEGMSIRYLVPPPVEMYIAEHGLYRR